MLARVVLASKRLLPRPLCLMLVTLAREVLPREESLDERLQRLGLWCLQQGASGPVGFGDPLLNALEALPPQARQRDVEHAVAALLARAPDAAALERRFEALCPKTPSPQWVQLEGPWWRCADALMKVGDAPVCIEAVWPFVPEEVPEVARALVVRELAKPASPARTKIEAPPPPPPPAPPLPFVPTADDLAVLAKVRALLEPLGVATDQLGVLGGAGVVGVPIHVRKAFATWAALRSRVTETGLTPLLVHGCEELLVESVADAQKAIAELPRPPLQVVDEEERPLPAMSWEPQHGAGWWLCFVPTTEPWAVFAWFRFGGFNGCPEPEEHLDFARDWCSR